jgi:fused signal recognition particle receptor
MEELRKLSRVIKKILPEAPHETLLVIDAATGQNGIKQAKEFSDAVGVTGLILTKLDGTAKGGIVLRINKELLIPVKYIGVGEQLDDLQAFNPAEFIDALVG